MSFALGLYIGGALGFALGFFIAGAFVASRERSRLDEAANALRLCTAVIENGHDNVGAYATAKRVITKIKGTE